MIPSHFKITIDTQNAAFDGVPVLEVARILRLYAAELLEMGEPNFQARSLFDENGNRVGQAKFYKEG